MISNQQGNKLKVFKINNGLKFVSGEFNEFCRVEGIRRHNMVVDTLQQMGLTQRMNKTILEIVKCIRN